MKDIKEVEREAELKVCIKAEEKRMKKALPSIKLREEIDKFMARYKKLHAELKKMEALRSIIKNKNGCKVEVHTVLGVKYPYLNEKTLDESVIEFFTGLKEVYSDKSETRKTEKLKTVKERLERESSDIKRLIDVTRLTVRNISEEKEALVALFAESEDVILEASAAKASAESSESSGAEASDSDSDSVAEEATRYKVLPSQQHLPGVYLTEMETSLPLYFESGSLLIDFIKLNDDVEKSLEIVKGILSVFNAYRNKEFHSELGNLPIIDAIVENHFKYLDSTEGKLKAHPKGDPFINEWVYNLLILYLYVWAESVYLKDEVKGDEKTDLKVLVEDLLDRLHPSIKKALATRGIKIYINMYAGLDCEFERVQNKFKKNKLLSTQLVGNTNVYFKIPREYKYVMQYINPSTSKATDIAVNEERKEGFKQILENSVNEVLRYRDKLKRGEYWKVLKEVGYSIEAIEGVQKYEGAKEYVLYELPFSLMKEFIEIDQKAIESVKNSEVEYGVTGGVEKVEEAEEVDGRVEEDLEVNGEDEGDVYEDEDVHEDVEEEEEDVEKEEEEEEEEDVEKDSRVIEAIVKNNAEFSVDELVSLSNKLLFDNVKFNVEQINVILGNTLKRLMWNASKDLYYLNNNNKELKPYEEVKRYEDEKSLDSIESIETTFSKRIDLKEVIEKAFSKRSSRFKYTVPGAQISVSTEKNLYLAGHNTPSDFSLLTDFDLFKHELDIVQKSFVTRGRPLTGFNETWGSRVYIRDTMLLAPPNSKSLKALGRMLGEGFHKVELHKYRGDMLALLRDDFELFNAYAIQDSRIVVKYINEMSSRYFKLGKIGVPLTVSAISKEFIMKEWNKRGYQGYQVDGKYLLGNVGKVSTPIGLQTTGKIGMNLSKFTASFRGGRNESFMYGAAKGSWYDYDLTSAYTTAMCILGNPVYKKMRFYTQNEVDSLPIKHFFRNYMAIEVRFEYPINGEGVKRVKYPCIPQNADEFTTIYPMKGESVITGFEYIQAKNSGCKFTSVQAVSIPFQLKEEEEEEGKDLKIITTGTKFENSLKNENVDSVGDYYDSAPFIEIEEKIQAERRKHSKGSFENSFYKLLGNAGYGLVCQGLGSKRKFDIKTKGMVVMTAGELSNPVLAASITGFIRAVIAETLNNINKLGGRVISVTTDGFITDIENLEEKLLTLELKDIILLKYYRIMRAMLSGDSAAFELKKKEENGVLSWCTRGQVGRSESGILAVTGFQVRGYTHEKLFTEFSEVMRGKKLIVYTQSSLRGAKQVYEEGGHVTAVYNDQSFRVIFDNKRRILTRGMAKDQKLFDSIPWIDAATCKSVRNNAKIAGASTYNKYLSKPKGSVYKNPWEVGVRAFVRWLVLNNKMVEEQFDTYDKIIGFVRRGVLDNKVNISKSSISKLKARTNLSHSLGNSVPRLPEVQSFFAYVEKHILEFKAEDLLMK